MNTVHPKILALDLATTTGWAMTAAGIVTSGSQCFARLPATKTRPAEHMGEPFAQFHRWLAEKIRTDKPEAIAYEEVMRFPYALQAHSFGGLRGHMLALAAGHGIPCFAYAVTHVKKFWTGKGNADKDDMVAATLLKLPWVDPTDDNECDALAILHLHLSQHESMQHLSRDASA
jgi:Holliday junction resolvasome RuvABC endonuclease subunit